MESVIDEIAFALGKDPLEVRKINLYGDAAAQHHAVSSDGRQLHRAANDCATGTRR